MSDEPGLPATDGEKAALMLRLVKAVLQNDTPDGLAGVDAVLLEMRAADPGSVERLAASIQLGRLGGTRSTAH